MFLSITFYQQRLHLGGLMACQRSRTRAGCLRAFCVHSAIFLSLFDRRCACGCLHACFPFSCLSGCLLANAAPFSQAGVPLPGRREFVPLFQPWPRGRASLVLSPIYDCDAAFRDRCNASHRYRPMACLTFCNLCASRILIPLPSLLT